MPTEIDPSELDAPISGSASPNITEIDPSEMDTAPVVVAQPAPANIPPVASSAPPAPIQPAPPQNDAISQLKDTATKMGITSDELTDRRAQAQKGMEEQAIAANQAKNWYPSIDNGSIKPGTLLEGIPRGMKQGMVGLDQLLQSDRMDPDTRYKEDLQQVAKNLELQGKGSGISGTTGEIVGQMTNPVNAAALAAPEGVLGRVAAGALMGAAQPETEQGQRATNIGASAALNAVIPPVVGKATEATGSLLQGIANKTGATSAANALISKLPARLGIKPTTSDLYQSAKDIGMDIKGKSPTEIKDNLQAAFTKTTGDIKDIISGGKELNPVAANVAISNHYEDALARSNQLYGKVKELGEGKFANAKDLNNNINNLIGDLEQRKFLEPAEERALNELKYWKEKILGASKNTVFDNGSNVKNIFASSNTTSLIPFNDVVELKQVLNQNFNPKNFPTRADTPFVQLNSSVNDILDTIAKQTAVTLKSPETDFSTALTAANEHWRDTSKAFKNESLKPFWTPEDYYESKALTERGTPLSTTLRKRARGWLNKIATPEDLETLTDALPPQVGNALKGAKFEQIMEEAGLDPKAIYENKDTLDRIIRNNPDAAKLLNRVYGVMKALNKRGLGNTLPGQIDKEASQEGDNALRSIWSLATNHKLYALKHALDTISPKEKSAGKALKGFQKEIQAGGPLRQSIKKRAKGLAPYIAKPAGLIAAKSAID